MTSDLPKPVGRPTRGLEAPVQVVPIRTAEMVKYADNAFHAVKIAFANEVAQFGRRSEIDGREAMRLDDGR